MLDFPLMLQMKLPGIDIIQSQSNKFALGVENKATGDSKCDSLDHVINYLVPDLHYSF